MSVPARMQLSRRPGFRLQTASRELNGLYAINVARPTRWGNPWKVGAVHPEHGWPMSREEAIALFEHELRTNAELRRSVIVRLRGFNLACWCKLGELCHADALLEVTNSNEKVSIDLHP